MHAILFRISYKDTLLKAMSFLWVTIAILIRSIINEYINKTDTQFTKSPYMIENISSLEDALFTKSYTQTLDNNTLFLC